MKKFYTYIFGASYMFSVNVLKEKEFPYVWAGTAVGFLSFINIRLVFQIVEYLILPYRLNIYYDSHKFLALIYIAIIILWVYRKKRYLDIVKEYQTISNERTLRILSICYYIISFMSFFIMSDLFRNYNLTH